MTKNIREYFKIKNSPVGNLYEELGKNCRMLELLGDAPKLTQKCITRFVLDNGDSKVCVYETDLLDENEKAFVIHELQRKYAKRVFAINEMIFEVEDD